MANHTQLLVQLVFAVKGRQSLITEAIRSRVETYMNGVIESQKCRPLAMYCNPDHCHILVGLHPTITISDLVKAVKAKTSKWINENKLLAEKFAWQEGYGAFTYSYSQLEAVVKYVQTQPERHRRISFKQEYLDFLQKFEIAYDERYLFSFLESELGQDLPKVNPS